MLDEELERNGFISLGWDHVPDLGSIDLSTTELAPILREADADASLGRVAAHAGMLRRFHNQVSVGDIAVAPRKNSDRIRVGVVAGPYFYQLDAREHKHRIPVQWVDLELQRAQLPESVRNGLRNISTLSRITKEPEFWTRIAHNSSSADQWLGEKDRAPHTWLVNANIDGEDYAEQFVRDGVWHTAGGLDKRARSMQVGERIAIKSQSIQIKGLPFDNRGLGVSCMTIRARGVITQVLTDHIRVDWDQTFQPRKWYFYTFVRSVQRLSRDHRYTPALEAFIYDDEEQDLERFLADPFWGRYTEESTVVGAEPDSFKSVRPSVTPIYEAMNKWRESVLNGTSLFSGEPLNYREAAAALVSDFVEQPLNDGRSFIVKLKDQLEASPASAIQLAAELLYVYCLPMHQRSMGRSAKVDLINTVTSWSDEVATLPEELAYPLATGTTRVGTAYHTLRWKAFSYLVLLVQSLASLSKLERGTALGNLASFQHFAADVDDQSAWAMRYLIEHLLFPDEAINTSSRGDRAAMRAALGAESGSDDVNALVKELPPNVRYGSSFEINPYAAPHRYRWTDLGEVRQVWGEWAALVLRDSAEVESHLGEETTPRDLSILELLETGAARALSSWETSNRAAFERISGSIEEQGLAKVIDDLSAATEWSGAPEEFVEAATAILSTVSDNVPHLGAHLVHPLHSELGNISLAPSPSPGELTLGVLEALDTFGVAISRLTGLELRRAHLAALAQQLRELDPVSTPWSTHTQERYLDWRSGRGNYGPFPEDSEEPDSPSVTSRPAPVAEPTIEEDIPKDIDDLARRLTFDTDDGREWLETTKQLLHDRRQIILQGPPGTGKTYIAQKLALFLAGSSERITTVQFHPATAYEDFIQGLRPTSNGSSGFELRPGPLLRLAERARSNPTKQHILIIDEINRANLPAVFGELYFLLEYRETAVHLLSGEHFSLPKNLWIIGTMNTADRSIASIDAALRRRFYIQDLRPEDVPLREVLPRWLHKNEIDMNWLPELLSRANELIGDEDQHIGPSHFLRLGLTEAQARFAWKHAAIPTLREHFYGQPDRLNDFKFNSLKSHALRRDAVSD